MAQQQDASQNIIGMGTVDSPIQSSVGSDDIGNTTELDVHGRIDSLSEAMYQISEKTDRTAETMYQISEKTDRTAETMEQILSLLKAQQVDAPKLASTAVYVAKSRSTPTVQPPALPTNAQPAAQTIGNQQRSLVPPTPIKAKPVKATYSGLQGSPVINTSTLDSIDSSLPPIADSEVNEEQYDSYAYQTVKELLSKKLQSVQIPIQSNTQSNTAQQSPTGSTTYITEGHTTWALPPVFAKLWFDLHFDSDLHSCIIFCNYFMQIGLTQKKYGTTPHPAHQLNESVMHAMVSRLPAGHSLFAMQLDDFFTVMFEIYTPTDSAGITELISKFRLQGLRPVQYNEIVDLTTLIRYLTVYFAHLRSLLEFLLIHCPQNVLPLHSKDRSGAHLGINSTNLVEIIDTACSAAGYDAFKLYVADLQPQNWKGNKLTQFNLLTSLVIKHLECIKRYSKTCSLHDHKKFMLREEGKKAAKLQTPTTAIDRHSQQPFNNRFGQFNSRQLQSPNILPRSSVTPPMVSHSTNAMRQQLDVDNRYYEEDDDPDIYQEQWQQQQEDASSWRHQQQVEQLQNEVTHLRQQQYDDRHSVQQYQPSYNQQHYNMYGHLPHEDHLNAMASAQGYHSQGVMRQSSPSLPRMGVCFRAAKNNYVCPTQAAGATCPYDHNRINIDKYKEEEFKLLYPDRALPGLA